jgi:sugar/nucleoside kinase (ribokinase family)
MKLSEKQERWIIELEDLWNFFEARLKSYKLKTHDFRLIVLLNMTLAVHRLIRGFMAQLKGGSNDGLQSYLRTLTETTININYILSDDTDNSAKAFILDSKRSRSKALGRIINLLEQDGAPSMARVNSIESYKKLKLRLEQELSEQESRLGANNVNWPRIVDRAVIGNCDEMYATVFWHFSQDTHMTADSLDRFAKEVDGGIAFTTKPDLSDLDLEIQSAYAYYFIFINLCSEKLGFPAEEELRKFHDSEMLSKV